MSEADITPLPPLHRGADGFAEEFRDLDHYIRAITARIWEGREIDAIRRWYADDCAVITPSGATTHVDAVVRGTLETLHEFPDRRLLAEDVVPWSADGRVWLSSHRIVSTMTHRGAGAFGPPAACVPTGRVLHVRTVADCVCRGNRIVHEWLVRDQGAIARQLDIEPRELAQRWLDAGRPAPQVPFAEPSAPAGWCDPLQHEAPAAGLVASAYLDAWSGDLAAIARSADEAIDWRGPGGDQRIGRAEVEAYWFGLTAAFAGARFEVSSLVEHRRAQRTPVVAMRWRLRGVHVGGGLFGAPTGRDIDLLGITHAEVADGRVLREWLLLDEVALWMQLLAPAAKKHEKDAA